MDKQIERMVKEETKDVVILTNEADTLAVRNDKDVVKATEFLTQLKAKLKSYNEKRLTYTAPLNQSLKAINETYKELTEPLKRAEEIVKTNILGYRQLQEKERLLKEKELQKQNGNREISIETSPSVVESESGKIRTRKIWKYKITNKKAIPLEYLMLDESKIREEIKSGTRKIPGVRIYEEESLSVYKNQY